MMGWMQRGWGGGEVDALGQGALDGGIMGGSRVPVEQARLLNQVHAVGVCAAGEKKYFFWHKRSRTCDFYASTFVPLGSNVRGNL